MTQTSPTSAPANPIPISVPIPKTFTAGYLFGVPLGNLGWFSSLLIAVASGFMAFFAATFCAIVFILVYNTALHGSIDFALSYRRVGLPAGLLVLAIALSYLGTLWCKRIFRRS
jgi:hypothetical protein